MPPRKKATVERVSLTPAALAAQVNKHFGAGTMKFASDPRYEIQRLPTGILSVDFMLNGGIARGRHTEIFGTWSVGKTFLALRTIAETQANGGTCAYLDVENSFDPVFAAAIGVDNKKLALPPLPTANKYVDFIEMLLYSRLYDVIVIDSIAALLPQDERDRSSEQTSMGTYQARLMSAALRKLTTANERTALIWINQLREAVGDMWKHMTTSGGKAMGFYAGTRLELTKVEDIKSPMVVVDPKTGNDQQKDVVIGHRVVARLEKDKTGNTPKDQTTFVYDQESCGVDEIEDLIYLGLRLGLVHKAGEKWYVEGHPKDAYTGRKRFKGYLRKSPDVVEELTNLIWEVLEGGLG